jgi:dihydroorotate dehydrogenase electron transfer subunit
LTGEAATTSVDAIRPRRLDLPVVARQAVGGDFCRLVLDAPPDWQSLPGQFINILCQSDPRAAMAAEGRPLDAGDAAAEWPRATGLEISRRWPVVRRPYSVSRVRCEGARPFRPGTQHGTCRAGCPRRPGGGPGRVRIEILVRGVGTGSRFLQARPVGSSLNVVGPLGNAFTAPADDRRCILVGGGCGVAPIFGLSDYLAAAGRPCVFILGAASLDDMPATFKGRPAPTGDRIELCDTIEEVGARGIEPILATDDGSAGFHGTAAQALEAYLSGRGGGASAALYGCGPMPMLKALAEIARRRGLPCQVSLERFMGCGIGVCLSCATKRRDATSDKGWTFRLTCREGPVVDASDMIWE